MNSTVLKTIPGPDQHMLQIIGSMRRQGFLNYIADLWQTYGDLFRLKLGPRELIFALHPEAIRYVNITNRQNYDKLGSYDLVRKYLLGQGLVSSTGDLWRRQRKLMAPFYTPQGVQAYAQIMLRDGQRLRERWEGLADSAGGLEIYPEMTRVTASIILKAMFSLETNGEIEGMKNAVEVMISFVGTTQTAMLRPPVWVPTSTNRRYNQAREQIHTQINGIIQQRRSLPEAEWPDDLLGRLMRVRDEETGAPMSESLLRDESITTFFAGHETTARTMAYAWYALASNPEVADKLHAELDRELGSKVPTVEDLHRLPYTLQVIKETLRLYPPAPFYIRDAVADDTIAGYAVPGGASVMMSPYFTHRHPAFWDEPLRFDPERWTPEREAQQAPYAYHPFAAGQRVCIGNNFSLLESHILLALLAQRFAPRLNPGFEPQWVMQGTLNTRNGLPMVIERRN